MRMTNLIEVNGTNGKKFVTKDPKIINQTVKEVWKNIYKDQEK